MAGPELGQAGVVIQTRPAIIRTLMKIVLNMFLLVGMLPGAVLPSFITDRLLAPAPFTDSDSVAEGEFADVSGGRDVPGGPQGESDSNQEPDSILVVPSSYSAIRPIGFQFFKGELHSIHGRQECLIETRQLVNQAVYFSQSSRPLAWRMRLDFCPAYELAITSPPIRAHAPPILS